MDLILWRHAEAQELSDSGDWLRSSSAMYDGEERGDSGDDLARVLTPRGEKDAARMGKWLDRMLPEGARILCSPAVRCEQTALALGRRYKIRPELAPDGDPGQLLQAAQWPYARQLVVIVGHQPTLGQTIAGLLGMTQDACAVRKGAAWWLRSRERNGQLQTVLVSVQSPDLV